MANEYEKIALATRKKISKLTLEQQRQMLKLYENSIDNLATKITKSEDKSLNQRWLIDYQKELKRVSNALARDIELNATSAIGQAAKIGTETEQQIMSKIFNQAGLDIGDHFTSMFSQVQNQVVENIISGNLYKDKLTLSQRIWNHSGKFERDIQYVINQGMLEKKSAIELARDLEQFVKPPARRPWGWRKIYPILKNTPVEYNSMRLARTTINHSYQNSTIQSSNMNPFVEGIEWQSAQIHGRTCDLCLERHGQVFPKGNVPLDHPNGLCTMLPYIPKDLDTVADELRDWIDGGDNPMLDKWYNEYGENFGGLERAKDLLEKNQQAYDVRGIKKPKRPSFRDYPGGVADENFIRDRAAYRRDRETYDELMNQQVDRALKREFNYDTPEKVLAAGRERGIEIDPMLLNGEHDLRAFDELFECYDELREKYPQAMKYEFDYEGRKIPSGVNRIMKGDGDGAKLYYAAFDGDTLKLGDRMLESYEDSMRHYLESTIEGHFSEGNGTYKNLFNHEFGHAIDTYIKNTIRSGKEAPQYLSKMIEYENGKRKIYADYGPPSEYGGTDLGEFFAETFSAYEGGEQTELTKAFGKFLEGWL